MRTMPKYLVQLSPARAEHGWYHFGLAVVTVREPRIVSAYLTDAETVANDGSAPRFVSLARRSRTAGAMPR